MSEEPIRDGEFDEWLDAIDAGESYYYECEAGHGGLPPMQVCPTCGSSDVETSPLPESGEIDTYTTVNVAAPQFDDDTPYVTAVADFGPVRLTGVVRGLDPEEVDVGTEVTPTIEETETTGERLLTFRPA